MSLFRRKPSTSTTLGISEAERRKIRAEARELTAHITPGQRAAIRRALTRTCPHCGAEVPP